MTRVFTVDKNNDLVLATDGNLSISSDLEAVMQACEHAAKAQLTEMVLSTDTGVPNFQTIWQGSPNLIQFEAGLRRQLLAVTGVIEVQELTTAVVDDVVRYSATIRTIYGEGALNGV